LPAGWLDWLEAALDELDELEFEEEPSADALGAEWQEADE